MSNSTKYIGSGFSVSDGSLICSRMTLKASFRKAQIDYVLLKAPSAWYFVAFILSFAAVWLGVLAYIETNRYGHSDAIGFGIMGSVFLLLLFPFLIHGKIKVLVNGTHVDIYSFRLWQTRRAKDVYIGIQEWLKF